MLGIGDTEVNKPQDPPWRSSHLLGKTDVQRVLQAEAAVSADALGRERGWVYWQKDTPLGEPEIPDPRVDRGSS